MLTPCANYNAVNEAHHASDPKGGANKEQEVYRHGVLAVLHCKLGYYAAHEVQLNLC